VESNIINTECLILLQKCLAGSYSNQGQPINLHEMGLSTTGCEAYLSDVHYYVQSDRVHPGG